MAVVVQFQAVPGGLIVQALLRHVLISNRVLSLLGALFQPRPGGYGF